MVQLFYVVASRQPRVDIREVKHDVYSKRQAKFPFRQNTEKLNLIKLLSWLLTRYIE